MNKCQFYFPNTICATKACVFKKLLVNHYETPCAIIVRTVGQNEGAHFTFNALHKNLTNLSYICLNFEKNTSLAAPGALAHRLQRRTACQWAPKWPTGSGKVSTPRFWGAPVNFR